MKMQGSHGTYELFFFCLSLLPRKAILAVRELLDTGVDFGWWAALVHCDLLQADACRNESKPSNDVSYITDKF